MSHRKLPINWPSDFQYSGRSVVHGIHPNLFFQLLSSNDPKAIDQREACTRDGPSYIRIQRLAAPHPLKTNLAFCHKRIPKVQYLANMEIDLIAGGEFVWGLWMERSTIFLRGKFTRAS